jgi:hypothetical protein
MPPQGQKGSWFLRPPDAILVLILKTLAFFTQCALKDQFSSSLSEDELDIPASP